MNTNQKINKAMNIRSKIQKENIFIPMKQLRESEDELFEKIEALRSSVIHQLDTLKNWNDKTPQSKEKYAEDCVSDSVKLERMERSYRKICDEMKNSISKG